ncbi:hypothetical protein E2562_004630 [Oryza meyeriana var. granulata]|uniref:Uncharacterized protein n=1 Tax=Oryza meyeriana var. granulata TaxID=110450 RepID=A0A6G1F3P6_9ORYZ|nr:hypothetical protein E2562_004630 [Oryza meyeriana var. granulata]
MADLTGGGTGAGGGGGSAGRRRPLGFLKNAAKRKDGFVQLLLMAGVLMMSLRSLGQKHRLLASRTDLSLRMRDLQDALHREANADELARDVFVEMPHRL